MIFLQTEDEEGKDEWGGPKGLDPIRFGEFHI